MLLELITHKHYSMRFSGPGFTRLRLVSFALYFHRTCREILVVFCAGFKALAYCPDAP